MRTNITDEERTALSIVKTMTETYGINLRYHVMTSISSVQANCTVWVESYEALDQIHKHLISMGATPSQIDHCYSMKYDEYNITYKGL